MERSSKRIIQGSSRVQQISKDVKRCQYICDILDEFLFSTFCNKQERTTTPFNTALRLLNVEYE